MRRTIVFALSLVLATASSVATADQVTLTSSKDNTLYESVTGSISNALGQGMFAGNTGSGSIRRALVAFDIAASVPSGAMINDVTRTLTMNRTPDNTARTTTLHKVLADWGQGGSNAGDAMDGAGALATVGDPTWLHTFFPNSNWSAVGGDFSPVASASVSVGANGTYTWGSTPQMVADVQSWLDDQPSNFGWLLKGIETAPTMAKRFATRENSTASSRPSLVIDFTNTTPTLPTAWGAIKALYR